MSNLLNDVDDIRDRSRADRPSPAIPLLLLGLVVTGALIATLIRKAVVEQPVTEQLAPDGMVEFALYEAVSPRDPVLLGYWVIASVAAYLLALWIARRQGYRRGMWVDRRPLAIAGIIALVVAVFVIVGWYAPADLLIRVNLPLLAIAAALVIWARRERSAGLWAVAVIMVPLTLLANLYNMENVLYRLGAPVFNNADVVANLGAVALALFIAAAIFGLTHRHDAATVLPLRAPEPDGTDGMQRDSVQHQNAREDDAS